MYISSKGEYGIRALFDLAQHYDAGPIQSRDIRVRQRLDENYLNQILISLRKAGLIESTRGPQGGHRKHPADCRTRRRLRNGRVLSGRFDRRPRAHAATPR